ncbi:MAG: N-acetylneuraminate synthase family protein [Bernardetiaceae bacterium]|jgi:N-acetylneuraminate synthase|nr:N-acetylneuraminate synthase family protein [Bernardetiaceae bacterium]
MQNFEIAHRPVGPGVPPLVIAEIGINHEGSLVVAKQMVDAAARAGVEVVKHQTHIVEDEMSPEAKKVVPGNADVSIYEIMRRCALSEAEEWELKQYVEAKGMIFISTPFSRAAALRLRAFGVPAFKIGSGECNNLPLVDLIASFGKPMIVSTGMNSLESVKKTVATIRRHGTPLALMHTTNLYPTPPHLVRLGAMQALMAAFPDVPVGLSDHTTSNHACLAAVALGAALLERHFTDHLGRPGPDIVCSMDEPAARELIAGSGLIYQMRGGQKQAVPEEQVTIDFAFATVVTLKPVAQGELFSLDNLWVKRPGTGAILAEHFQTILGKAATRDLPADYHLAWQDFA